MTPNLLDEFEKVMREMDDAHEHVDAAFIAMRFLRTHAPTLADMAKRLEAAQRDARRWRKIRDCNDFVGVYQGLASADCGLELLIGDEADAAIDATQEDTPEEKQ